MRVTVTLLLDAKLGGIAAWSSRREAGLEQWWRHGAKYIRGLCLFRTSAASIAGGCCVIQHSLFCRFCSPKTCTITPGNAQCAACGFHHTMFFATLSIALPQTRPISNVVASRPLISPAAPSTLGSQSNSLRLALRVLANSCSSVTDSLFQVRAALGSLESV